jgi:hypothetical protein
MNCDLSVFKTRSYLYLDSQRNLLPSFVYVAKLVHNRQALSSTVINFVRSRVQVKPATLLILIDLLSVLWWRSFRYPLPKWLLFLCNVGSVFQCLRSFSFLFAQRIKPMISLIRGVPSPVSNYLVVQQCKWKYNQECTYIMLLSPLVPSPINTPLIHTQHSTQQLIVLTKVVRQLSRASLLIALGERSHKKQNVYANTRQHLRAS